MRQQVAHADRVPDALALGQVLRDRIVERDRAVAHEGEHAGGGELLGDRADAEQGGVGGRGAGLEIGEAVAAQLDHAAAVEHDDRQAGDVPLGHGTHDRAVERVGVRRQRRRAAADRRQARRRRRVRPRGGARQQRQHAGGAAP